MEEIIIRNIEKKIFQVLQILKQMGGEILKNARNDKKEENKEDGSLVTKYDETKYSIIAGNKDVVKTIKEIIW